MRNTRLVGTLWLVALSAGSSMAAAGSPQWMTSFDEAQREAQRLDRPMLVHFYTDWCFPCRRMEQEVLSRATVLQVLESRLVLVKLNADHHQHLAKRFGVSLFPTDIIVNPSGQRILSSTGFQEADKYVRFARDAERQFVAMHRPVEDNAQVSTESTPRSIGVAVDGYCPVTLWEDRQWVKGDPQHVIEHRGQTYYLSSAQRLAEFEADPRKYVPQLLGCDPVILMETDLAVPGSVQFGAFYDDELFLFSTAENRATFKLSPDRYTRTRIVRNIDEIDRPLVR